MPGNLFFTFMTITTHKRKITNYKIDNKLLLTKEYNSEIFRITTANYSFA